MSEQRVLTFLVAPPFLHAFLVRLQTSNHLHNRHRLDITKLLNSGDDLSEFVGDDTEKLVHNGALPHLVSEDTDLIDDIGQLHDEVVDGVRLFHVHHLELTR